jgi:hypothetical protein
MTQRQSKTKFEHDGSPKTYFARGLPRSRSAQSAALKLHAFEGELEPLRDVRH